MEATSITAKFRRGGFTAKNLRQKYRNKIKHAKTGCVVVNTKEKADKISEFLKDRILCRYITAYNIDDFKKRGSHLHAIIYKKEDIA